MNLKELIAYLEKVQADNNSEPIPDEEKALAIGTTEQDGQVVLAFGKPIIWLKLGPNEALNLAGALGQTASAILSKERQAQ